MECYYNGIGPYWSTENWNGREFRNFLESLKRVVNRQRSSEPRDAKHIYYDEKNIRIIHLYVRLINLTLFSENVIFSPGDEKNPRPGFGKIERP